jgi:hypothetical protein
MLNATLRFVDDKHLKSDWELFENGAKKSVETFELARVR